jgi:hypothetical protein
VFLPRARSAGCFNQPDFALCSTVIVALGYDSSSGFLASIVHFGSVVGSLNPSLVAKRIKIL